MTLPRGREANAWQSSSTGDYYRFASANGKVPCSVVECIRAQWRVSNGPRFFLGDRVQFEKDCSHIQSTVQDFLSWANDEGSLPDAHPLKAYSNQEHFAYADYMHLPELLDNDQDPLMRVSVYVERKAC